MLGDRGPTKDFKLILETSQVIGCQFGDEAIIFCHQCLFRKEAKCANTKPQPESLKKE